MLRSPLARPRSRTGCRGRLAGTTLAALVLAACSTSPEIERAIGTSTREARLALELGAAAGPVRGAVQGQPPAADRAEAAAVEGRVLAVMADAVPALGVTFSADPGTPPAPSLVVTFGALEGTVPCTPPAVLGDPRHVVAAFCEGDRAIGAVAGTASSDDDPARTRLLRRLARGLFPDLYVERFGLGTGSGPFGVSVDGSVDGGLGF